MMENTPPFTLAHLPPLPPPVHLAIGMFDGIHLGHQKIIRHATETARATSGTVAVLTFTPHPSHLLHPHAPVPQILNSADKDELLRALGAGCIIHEPFTRQFAAHSVGTFLDTLLHALPALATIHVGEDFRFGHARTGDVRLLQTHATSRHLRIHSIASVEINGARISSTRIRELIATGRVTDANTLLGRPYASHGTIIPGRALARTLGFPTFNTPWTPELQPRHGVYAIKVRTPDTPHPLCGLANYGLRPTVTAETPAHPLLEVHLFTTATVLANTGLKPGAALHAEWLHFIRPEKKFPTLDALRAQITDDVAAAQNFFKSTPIP